MNFGEAIDDAMAHAMQIDHNIVVFGEDVQITRKNLLLQFGKQRIRDAPISESAFVGCAVTAAMGGLRPVVEVIMVDFIGVAMDALLNHASKVEAFSGGKWKAPLVVRMACGGGYGDGGQHEQSLWGWLAHIPGLVVVIPSTPADAGGLMLSALRCDEPVIYLEHKLLSEQLLSYLGSGGRKTIQFDVPLQGSRGSVPDEWQSLPFGQAAIRRIGSDITLVSLGVSAHRALEAAEILASNDGIQAEVIDLRTIAPLDSETVIKSVMKTRRLIVIDEDYERFGLSGELAAILLEAGISAGYARVCTRTTIPFSRNDEFLTLPNKQRIIDSARNLTLGNP